MTKLKALYAIALMLIMSGAAWAQGHVAWAETWEGALAEAKARNVPLHVTIHKDG